MQPLITVIIPTYNRANTIRRAINSVLEQTYANIELIVVDDCSSDNTVEIVNAYRDNRIKLMIMETNSGANVARNRGIDVAKGDYIAFQDSDDEWMKDKLAIQLDYMKNNSKEVCYCSYLLHNNGECRIVPNNAEKKKIYEENVVDILRKRNVISTQTLLMHKNVIANIGMFDESLNRLQDYELVIRICQQFKIGYVERPLVNVYRMEECISSNKSYLLDAYRKIWIKHNEFIDFESFLKSYLFNCDWYDVEGIHWEYLDDLLGMLKEKGVDIKQNEKQIVQVKQYMSEWYNYFRENIMKKEFTIYGAGIYGKKVYSILKKMGIIPKYFCVTNRGKEDKIDQIPVLELSNNLNKNLSIIVAVNADKQGDIIDNLVSKGFLNYYVYPFS